MDKYSRQAIIEFDFAAFGEITGLFYHNDDAEGVSIFQMEAESDDCTARAGYGCEKSKVEKLFLEPEAEDRTCHKGSRSSFIYTQWGISSRMRNK